MAARTIETKAIISATDQTGNTFAAVAQKLKKMEDTAHAATRGVASATRAAQTAESVGAKAHRASGVALKAAGISTFTQGAAAALAGGSAAHSLIKASADRVHEAMRMSASGMSAKEIQQATLDAAKLGSQFSSIGQTSIMHMMRNARSIVGGYEELHGIMEPLLKLRVIAQANRPGQDVSEDFDQLVKGLEIKGVTQHPEQFKNYMEGIAKGLNIYGDTLKPYQYYEMMKYGRQATPGLSERFILSTAPELAQELGGSSYGNAVSGFNRALVGGKMDHAAFKSMLKLGLINDDDIEYTKKTREAKGLKAGRGAKGWELAQSDPNEWVKQYLLPAMAKAGFNTPEKISQLIGQLFSNRSAAQLVSILANQQSRIAKGQALYDQAPGLSASGRYMREDPTIVWEGFKRKMEDAAGTLGESLVRMFTPQLVAAANALSRFSRNLQQHIAEAPGTEADSQKKANRYLNRLIDLDSDKSFGQSTIDEDALSRMRRLREKAGDRNKLRRDRAARAAGIDPEKSGPEPTIGDLFGSGARAEWYRLHPTSGSLSDQLAAGQAADRMTYARRRWLRARGSYQHMRSRMASMQQFEERVSTPDMQVAGGLLSMPMSKGYGGVTPGMSTGWGYRPTVQLPPGVGTAPKTAQKVDVTVRGEPVEVRVINTVNAGSQLIAIAEGAKEATRKMKLDASIGSTGSTDFGNQQ